MTHGTSLQIRFSSHRLKQAETRAIGSYAPGGSSRLTVPSHAGV